jgi:hypothetical protein
MSKLHKNYRSKSTTPKRPMDMDQTRDRQQLESNKPQPLHLVTKVLKQRGKLETNMTVRFLSLMEMSEKEENLGNP